MERMIGIERRRAPAPEVAVDWPLVTVEVPVERTAQRGARSGWRFHGRLEAGAIAGAARARHGRRTQGGVGDRGRILEDAAADHAQAADRNQAVVVRDADRVRPPSREVANVEGTGTHADATPLQLGSNTRYCLDVAERL